MTEEDYYVFQMMILTTQFLKICRQFLFNINSLKPFVHEDVDVTKGPRKDKYLIKVYSNLEIFE